MIGCNLGSGQRRFTSVNGAQWINADIEVRPPDQVPDVQCDARSLAFADGAFDYVALHQAAEHFKCGGDGIFEESWRVLRPNGSLLIFLPDIRKLALRWLSGGISDWIYVVNLMGAEQGMPGDIHRWHYTREMLREALFARNQWRELKPFDWRAIPGSDLANDFWVLAMEAVK
jgi:predicted SAM-dependent methyltransferase